MLRREFVGITRGPLVYATGLIDGFKSEETVVPGAVRPGEADSVMLEAAGRAPISFEPYYRAGGRRDGAWRLTWLQLPPEEAA